MKKVSKMILAVSLTAAVLTGCANSPKIEQDQTQQSATAPVESTVEQAKTQAQTPAPVAIDLEKVKPDESGKIMVVMFHNFIESFKSGDKEYTTTFDDFRSLLQTLYDKDYRLINVNDYLNNDINVPAGKIPMVFTFDDGTAGQFNLVEENGQLVVNKQSAVGIMEEFNRKHPDFGLKGTFYVNLGLATFQGAGTVDQRLKYLIDKGFEIGNHTMTHISLPKVKTAEEILKEVGGNQKKMNEIIPGYRMNSLALPFGGASKGLESFVEKGNYEGTQYENKAIMLVGANPAPSPVGEKFNPLSTPRVRASGIKKVECDLDWWLEHVTRASQYISDGDPNTVTVPKASESKVDQAKLQGKTLRTY